MLDQDNFHFKKQMFQGEYEIMKKNLMLCKQYTAHNP